MKRIEATALVAYWLIASSLLAAGRLISESADIFAHSAAWRAAVGPLAVALLGLLAAWRLLRAHGGFRLGAALLALQIVSVSAGPLAYRLDAGPFLRIGFAASGAIVGLGSDARLLLIFGTGNRVPPGLTINLLAFAALLLLIAARRTGIDDTLLDDPWGRATI